MNPPSILEQIATNAPTKFVELLQESQERLLASWRAALEEAAIHEVKVKLKVSMAAVVDLEDDSVEYVLGFGGRYKLSVSVSLDDPKQPELPAMDGKGVKGKLKPRRRAANT